MSRYDGLIIPRSYSEYINKTDAATLQQALQLPGVLSGAIAAGDNKAVTSDAVYEALTDADTIQQALQLPGVLSGAIAAGDNKAVKSDAVNTALATKQDKLTFDTTPTEGSTNPVTSGGVANSLNPVVSPITFESIATTTESANCTYTVIDKLCIVNLAAVNVTKEGIIAKNLPKAKTRANAQWPFDSQEYVPIFYIDANSTLLFCSQGVNNKSILIYTQLIYPIAE